MDGLYVKLAKSIEGDAEEYSNGHDFPKIEGGKTYRAILPGKREQESS
jgi:hypothetical protein